MGSMRVAIVGATGAVGRETLRIVEERTFPLDELVLLASSRSAGKRLRFRGEEIAVGELGDGWFDGIDLALVSAGGPVSRRILPPSAAAGTVNVDYSSAFRMDPDVPLVIPEINGDAVAGHHGIVANPNCTAVAALMPLGPLHWAFGLTSLVISSYQSSSGAGMKGIRELAEQVEKLHAQEEDLTHPDPDALPLGDVFPRTLAFNVVPLVEVPDPEGSGFSTEELKVGNETRKILGIPALPVAATCVRVPTVAGHAVSVYARFERDITASSARDVLSSAEGVRVMDDFPNGIFPTPLDAAGIDDVLVGRIRQPEGDPQALMFFSVGDNLRKGAALNAVQIAELVVSAAD
jgi:aspartate-semialdehyde dehydrogenase